VCFCAKQVDGLTASRQILTSKKDSIKPPIEFKASRIIMAQAFSLLNNEQQNLTLMPNGFMKSFFFMSKSDNRPSNHQLILHAHFKDRNRPSRLFKYPLAKIVNY
jgi:hypothetical protein